MEHMERKKTVKFDFFCFEKDELDKNRSSFIKCFIEYDGLIIGDEKQPVLLGSLILSFQLLLDRLQNGKIIQTLKPTGWETEFEDTDDSMCAIPNHIESFDGCVARLYSCNSLTFLLVIDEFTGARMDISLELPEYNKLITKIVYFLNSLLTA